MKKVLANTIHLSLSQYMFDLFGNEFSIGGIKNVAEWKINNHSKDNLQSNEITMKFLLLNHKTTEVLKY